MFLAVMNVRRQPPSDRLNAEIPGIACVVTVAIVTFIHESPVQLVRDDHNLADIILANTIIRNVFRRLNELHDYKKNKYEDPDFTVCFDVHILLRWMGMVESTALARC